MLWNFQLPGVNLIFWFFFCHLFQWESSRALILCASNRERSCWIKVIQSPRSCDLIRWDVLQDTTSNLFKLEIFLWNKQKIYPMSCICLYLTLIATYSWIIIFTTLCSIKAEFRTINDVLDAWNKYFQRTLLNFFFTVKRNVLLIWRVICKFILGQLFLLWVILRIDLAHVPMNQYLLYVFLISQT